ncbi:MAG: diaminopropionate ammonia-lyase [Oscillospiraceae bacterium]|nr:diaminopropionate ammonia-lyase [Oscillospiraceae bacterium]
MKNTFSVCCRAAVPDPASFAYLSPERVKDAAAFHSGLPGYAFTPLRDLPALAETLGVSRILVKDESARFGLNAFKALGASYAIGKLLCERLDLKPDEETYRQLMQPRYRELLHGMTFITATDGNHGRGVAWAAKLLGCRAVVYLPQGTAEARLKNIQALGAEAAITAMNYDDTVRHAAETAAEHGWVLVQDTAWEGYEEIPAAIMQGYTTMAREIRQQLSELGEEAPTHLFLQAGVGSMAAAMAGYSAALWKERCPRIILVEPAAADCLYRTAAADDGRLRCVRGRMDSMMAGLCCGEPNPLAWQVLKQTASVFVSCDDSVAAEGMRVLGLPRGSDPVIVSGESGAVTTGAMVRILSDPSLSDVRRRLELNSDSRILLISTEGDTDPVNYQKILNT